MKTKEMLRMEVREASVALTEKVKKEREPQGDPSQQVRKVWPWP